LKSLSDNPQQGTPIGDDCYKISKGKSGGARVITYVLFIEEKVYLLSIYDKSEQENISDKIIEMLRKQIEE
jgi:hypothetical protein